MTDLPLSQPGPSDLIQPLPASQQTPAHYIPSSSATIADPAASISTIAALDADTPLVGGEEIDASMDQGINMTAGDNVNIASRNGANDSTAPVNSNEAPVSGMTGNVDPVGSAPPTKKESTLREFLGKMDDYTPIVRCDYLLLAAHIHRNIKFS
jgi:transcription initiation factor TFIID subunit 10